MDGYIYNLRVEPTVLHNVDFDNTDMKFFFFDVMKTFDLNST